jgi:predicted transcriptional regulator of viral defense system
MYRINKLAVLLQQNRRLFHTQDLRILWDIQDNNTLYTAISRYKKKKLLFGVTKGLYATVPLNQLDPWLLGIFSMHRYAYISCETVLFQSGIIHSPSQAITLVSEKSLHFNIGQTRYRSRKLKHVFLFNPIGVEKKGGIAVASTERAVADLLYFNPNAYLEGLVDWNRVSQLQEWIGYPKVRRS